MQNDVKVSQVITKPITKPSRRQVVEDMLNKVIDKGAMPPYSFSEREMDNVQLFATNEIVKHLQKLAAELIGYYDAAPARYEKLLPDKEVIITVQDVEAFRKVYAVLREAMSPKSVMAAPVANAIVKALGCSMNQDTPSKKELVNFYQKAKTFYFTIRYLSALDTPEADINRKFISKITVMYPMERSCPKYFLTYGEKAFGGSQEIDKVFLGKAFKETPGLSDLFKDVLTVVNGFSSGLYDLRIFQNISSFASRDLFINGIVEVEGFLDNGGAKIADGPQNSIFPEADLGELDENTFIGRFFNDFAETIIYSSIYGIDLKSLMDSYSLSKNTLRNIFTGSHLYAAATIAESDDKESYWILLSRMTCEGIQRELFIRAYCMHLNPPEGGNSIHELAGKAPLPDMSDVITSLERERDKESDRASSLQKKLENKEKRVAELEKSMRSLEKQNKDLLMEKEKRLASDKKAQEEKERQELDAIDIMENEVAPISELSDEEALEYFEQVIASQRVLIFGARENFEKRMSEKHPSLKFMHFNNKVTSKVFNNADMVVLRVDGIPHSKYYMVKEKVKLSGLPYRHMAKSDFNERRLYDAVIDMFEHS